MFFFFNDTATPEIYTLSLHDALPISISMFDKRPPQVDLLVIDEAQHDGALSMANLHSCIKPRKILGLSATPFRRSEEHTSELQSRQYLVCRLLLEKKQA